jgi:rSAM/selenodomain-associated transferase 1
MPRMILLFVKYPEPGRVKTRLAAKVGAAEAAQIYQKLVAAVCKSLPKSAMTVVCYDPPERRAEIESWLAPQLPATAQYHPQVPGDLGARLVEAFAHAFELGAEQVAVIGSDCIELTAAIFAETWRALEETDAAIGPSEDGGYYLLALKQPEPRLFSEIPWSTDEVLGKTLRAAKACGLRLHLLPILRDVDDENGWNAVRARLE